MGGITISLYFDFGGFGMSRAVRVEEPSAEMQEKIKKARDAIAAQKSRTVKCPYCQHNAIVIFEDTCGHIQIKCKSCGNEVIFDVFNMRRIPTYQQYQETLRTAQSSI